VRSALLALLGVALLAFGLFVAAVGLVVRVTAGGAGTVAAEGTVSTPSRALVLPVSVITADPPGTSLGVSVRAGAVPLVLARAPRAGVTAVLRGVDHEVARDLETRPLRLGRDRVEGRAVLTPPAERAWTAVRTGRDATLTLNWRVEEEDEQVVVARADGLPGIDTRLRLTADVPRLATVATVAAIAGGLVALAGAALALGGLLRARRPPPPAPPA